MSRRTYALPTPPRGAPVVHVCGCGRRFATYPGDYPRKWRRVGGVDCCPRCLPQPAPLPKALPDSRDAWMRQRPAPASRVGRRWDTV